MFSANMPQHDFEGFRRRTIRASIRNATRLAILPANDTATLVSLGGGARCCHQYTRAATGVKIRLCPECRTFVPDGTCQNCRKKYESEAERRL